jgi:ADP-dependent phosphofructokinase/glucokinase
MWTGLEHFDMMKVKRMVHKFPTGTTFLFQGTDMQASDHVNLITSCEDIISGLEIDPSWILSRDSLCASIGDSMIGNRHQVVFTL